MKRILNMLHTPLIVTRELLPALRNLSVIVLCLLINTEVALPLVIKNEDKEAFNDAVITDRENLKKIVVPQNLTTLIENTTAAKTALTKIRNKINSAQNNTNTLNINDEWITSLCAAQKIIDDSAPQTWSQWVLRRSPFTFTSLTFLEKHYHTELNQAKQQQADQKQALEELNQKEDTARIAEENDARNEVANAEWAQYEARDNKVMAKREARQLRAENFQKQLHSGELGLEEIERTQKYGPAEKFNPSPLDSITEEEEEAEDVRSQFLREMQSSLKKQRARVLGNSIRHQKEEEEEKMAKREARLRAEEFPKKLRSGELGLEDIERTQKYGPAEKFNPSPLDSITEETNEEMTAAQAPIVLAGQYIYLAEQADISQNTFEGNPIEIKEALIKDIATVTAMPNLNATARNAILKPLKLMQTDLADNRGWFSNQGFEFGPKIEHQNIYTLYEAQIYRQLELQTLAQLEHKFRNNTTVKTILGGLKQRAQEHVNQRARQRLQAQLRMVRSKNILPALRAKKELERKRQLTKAALGVGAIAATAGAAKWLKDKRAQKKTATTTPEVGAEPIATLEPVIDSETEIKAHIIEDILATDMATISPEQRDILAIALTRVQFDQNLPPATRERARDLAQEILSGGAVSGQEIKNLLALMPA